MRTLHHCLITVTTTTALAVLALAASSALASRPSATEYRCEALKSAAFTSIEDAPAQITSTIVVKQNLLEPEYCLAQGYVAPSIRFQIKLPSSWNGRLLKLGCAGHCGIDGDEWLPMRCGPGLRKGYACVTSDMGHSGRVMDALWARDNQQARIDWGYRATHVATIAAKEIVRHYYGGEPRKSYFIGCSTGGRQALQEAQRFPWDFDGIVAGAPPINLSTIYMTLAWGMRATQDKDGNPLLNSEDLKLLHRTALNQCDLDDGVRDGIISDPFHCMPDLSELTCKGRQAPGCLTSAQIDAVRKVYAGPMTSAGKSLTLGGPMVGSEAQGWNTFLMTRDAPAAYDKLTREGLRFLFFPHDPGPDWKPTDFDFDRDYKRLDLMQSLYSSSDVDLRRFKRAGGKLLVFHGLADDAVPPRDTVDYYETVERVMGGRAETQNFFRLFLLPGVAHCAGGSGADTVDYLSAIEQWVEHGQAPERLVAARVKTEDQTRPFWTQAEGEIEFTRPLHPYPSKATYRGLGEPMDAAAFMRVQ